MSPPSVWRRTGVLVAVFAPLFAGALTAADPASASSHHRHLLPGSVPNWATSQADRGDTADGAQLDARVYLAGRDPKALAAYAQAVSDPASPSYGKYLTAAAAKQRFGATSAQVAAVKSWLTSAGLRVTGVTTHYVSVRGSVAAAERAFGTRLHDYRVGSQTLRAPAASATVPDGLANAVLSVTGLDSAKHLMRHSETLPGPAPAFVNAPPCSNFYGQKKATTLPTAFGHTVPYVVCGYTPSQLRGAYGVTGSGLTGRGVTVAITDAFASPTIRSDADTYSRIHGEQTFRRNQFTQNLPADFRFVEECDAQGWYGEETLDVEAVHGMAPDAKVTYVGGASCADVDLLDALARVVDNRLADIVSNSWASLEQDNTPDAVAAFEQVFQLGAVEGIGFYFSSGDNGDEADSGTKQTDYPASDPWVTSVGGTSIGIGSQRDYQWETGWGTGLSTLSDDGTSWTPAPPGDFHGGAGGGTSHLFAEPFYQRRAVPASLATANGGAPARVVPDIAADADPNTGFLIGQTQTFPDGSVRFSEYRLGGTSLACPLIAGIQALAQQAARGRPVGFANPAIYARFGTAAYHDVTDQPFGPGVTLADARVDFANTVDASEGLVTSLRTMGVDTSLDATRGYDPVTGVGSPTRAYLRSFARR